MTDPLWIGLGLVGVAAFHLVPAHFKREIPTKMRKPLREADNPIDFLVTRWVFNGAGLVGLALILVGLLNRAGL